MIALYKPYGYLSQFTPEAPGCPHLPLSRLPLQLPGGVYPVGRLDADSEGLLLLTSDPGFAASALAPFPRHVPREYWCHVEGHVSPPQLAALEAGGIPLPDGHTSLPCRAWALPAPPPLPPRLPPVRVRVTVPDSWLALELSEGRNRQARRMCAGVGLPCLRLHRERFGGLRLITGLGLGPGEWRPLSAGEREEALLRSS